MCESMEPFGRLPKAESDAVSLSRIGTCMITILASRIHSSRVVDVSESISLQFDDLSRKLHVGVRLLAAIYRLRRLIYT